MPRNSQLSQKNLLKSLEGAKIVRWYASFFRDKLYFYIDLRPKAINPVIQITYNSRAKIAWVCNLHLSKLRDFLMKSPAAINQHEFEINTITRLGQILVRKKILSKEELSAALEIQKKYQLRLGECLLQLDLVAEEEVYKALAISRRLPYIKFKEAKNLNLDEEVLTELPRTLSQKHDLAPLAIRRIGGKKQLAVATSEPNNLRIFQELEFKLNLPIFVMVCSPSSLNEFIQRIYGVEFEEDVEATKAEAFMDMISLQEFEGETNHTNTEFDLLKVKSKKA